MLDGVISHDKITRKLSDVPQTSKQLWLKSKPLLVREIESDEGVLIICRRSIMNCSTKLPNRVLGKVLTHQGYLATGY